MSEYSQARQRILELMYEAAKVIERLPSEGQRRRLHETALDDLVDGRNAADLLNGDGLRDAFVSASREFWRRNDGWSRRVPHLRAVTAEEFDDLVKEGT